MVMRLTGSGGRVILGEDVMRHDHACQGDAERDGHDCSPHDVLLSERSPDSMESRGGPDL
jgi:hypothetical protein